MLCVILLTLACHLLLNGRLKLHCQAWVWVFISTFAKWNNDSDPTISLCSGRVFPPISFMAPCKVILNSGKHSPETPHSKYSRIVQVHSSSIPNNCTFRSLSVTTQSAQCAGRGGLTNVGKWAAFVNLSRKRGQHNPPATKPRSTASVWSRNLIETLISC